MGWILVLLLTPITMLAIGDCWRRLEARLWPAQRNAPAPAPGEVPLAHVVRDVLWRLDSTAARQFARFDFAVAEDLVVGGDRQAVEELLSLLCLYAIETTPCGRVLVTARRQAAEIAISIVDDGVGVALPRTGAVIDRAREMLAVLGGRLKMEFRKEVGTTATIGLPVHARAWDATIQSAMADFERVTREHRSASAAAQTSEADPVSHV